MKNWKLLPQKNHKIIFVTSKKGDIRFLMKYILRDVLKKIEKLRKTKKLV